MFLATSGDYRNWYEEGGRRFSHLIEPRSGRAVSHDLASVSVIHGGAACADALATALSVPGPSEGYALAESEGLAAYSLGMVLADAPILFPRLLRGFAGRTESLPGVSGGRRR